MIYYDGTATTRLCVFLQQTLVEKRSEDKVSRLSGQISWSIRTCRLEAVKKLTLVKF